MVVSLWGYYGFNYGDDIMMELFIDELTKKNAKVIIVDSHAGNLKQKVKNRKNVEVIDFFHLSKKEKFKTLSWLAKTTDLNFWGGGTVFTDEDADGNFRFFLTLKLLGGKIGYISVGIGDMKRASRKLKTKVLIKLTSIITLRDEKSYLTSKAINSNNSFHFEDVTYYYFNRYKTQSKKVAEHKKDNYLLVSFRSLENYFGKENEGKAADQLAEVIPDLMKKYQFSQVIFLPLDVKDVEINKKIQHSLDDSIKSQLLTNTSVDEMTEIIRDSSIYISGRLHGSVASEFFGIPTISLSYSNKINYFYESINFPYYIDLRKEDILLDKVETILRVKNEVAHSAIKKEAVDKAYSNINQLLTVLKG